MRRKRWLRWFSIKRQIIFWIALPDNSPTEYAIILHNRILFSTDEGCRIYQIFLSSRRKPPAVLQNKKTSEEVFDAHTVLPMRPGELKAFLFELVV